MRHCFVPLTLTTILWLATTLVSGFPLLSRPQLRPYSNTHININSEPLPEETTIDTCGRTEANTPETGMEAADSRRAFLTAVAAAASVVAVSNEPSYATSLRTSTAAIPSNTLATSASASEAVDWDVVLKKASKKALGGGKAGATAAVVQVCSLMWLRTSMNYQYRYGGTLQTSLQSLWDEGGLARLYQGLPFALVQGPLTRFGDTAANVGILALLESVEETRNLPLPLKTACGSVTAGLWRILLMPIDASKTAMQVEGRDGLGQLWNSVLSSGPAPLYRGALAQAAATAVGHFPWFVTYNYLDEFLPVVTADTDLLLSLGRSALLGLSASCVSDCCSNSLRVIKTTKQTAQLGKTTGDTTNATTTTNDKANELSYPEIVAMIVEKDGVIGLFGRGLQTRLLTNAIQGALFSVCWKYFQQVGVFAG